MTIPAWRLLLTALAASALAACSRSHAELGGDSSTHWLGSCSRDDQCGELSCVCGVCSTVCSESEQCSTLGTSALCLASTSGSCGGETKLCDQTCTSAAECMGTALTCVDGRCRALSSVVPATDGGTSSGAGEDAGPSSLICPPQRASTNGTNCARSAGYAWNGAACKEVVCGCVGEDCGSIAPTLEACKVSFASCTPESMCSGLPWYRCRDFCPTRFVFTGGGRSFAECEGDCRFELSAGPSIVLDEGSCAGFMASVHVYNTDGTERVVHMDLTEAAWEEAAQVSLSLEGAAVASVTPCPDCPQDLGEAWVTRGDERFSYTNGRAPAPLRAADTFVDELINQALRCKGEALIGCSTIGVGDDPIIGPMCSETEPVAQTSCECPVPFEELSALEGVACDASCASCQVPASTCGASCVEPCQSDGPRWTTWCTD